MSWELTMLRWINLDWSHPVLDWLMPALSAIEAWIPLLAVVVAGVAWRGGRRARLMLLCLALAVGVGDGVVSNTLKKAIGRVRPRDAVAGLQVRDLGPGSPAFLRLFQPPVATPSRPRGELRGKSFPSSHTVNMFAAATVVALFYRGWGVVVYLLAAGVALSRVYVAAHWPGDIPPSMALGVLVGWGMVLLVRRVARRWHPPGGPGTAVAPAGAAR